MRKVRGFTLLEVMVAVAIMGVIMVLIWSTTSQSLTAKDRIEGRDLIYHQGAVALRKVSEDVTMAFLTRRAQPPAEGAQGTMPSPAPEGTAPTGPEVMKSFFIGEDRGDRDSIRFSTLSHLRLYANAKESDQTKVAYELLEARDERGRTNLVRREDVWLDATTDVKGKALTLAGDVKEFALEYYDPRKQEWVTSWNSESVDNLGMLPTAVRIRVAFPDPDDENKSIPFSTAVLLPLSKGPINP